MSSSSVTQGSSRATSVLRVSPAAARFGFCAVLAASAWMGAAVTDAHETAQAVAQAGTDWAHLLRAMAALKALMALAAAAAVVWRLGSPAKPAWLAAYVLAGTAMMAGPGLVWELAHIGLGALLLHAGLAATLVLLWRDPQSAARLMQRYSRAIPTRE